MISGLIDTRAIANLREELGDRVITEGDPRYDEARKVVYGEVDDRPVLIVRVKNAADVARVIRLARETGLPLSVRSGGHSGAGHGVADGGIMIDLTDMKGLDIDVEGRTAWAETGLTAGEYTSAVGAHGLATGFGDTPSVGIGGITLGGGIGFLVRKYGLTIDDVLAAEIVTADGRILYIDDRSHPDLFWAIRGGGGNFGVVTKFKYRLHELKSIVGGMMLMPATPEVLAGLITLADEAPEELSIIFNVMSTPPMPMVPAEHVGKLTIMVLPVYAGDAEAGAKAMAPFRALATPILDMVAPTKYHEMLEQGGPPDGEGDEPHVQAVNYTMFLDYIDTDVAATLLDGLRSSANPMVVSQIRVLGGAMSRVPVEATAFAHRKSRIMVIVASLYTDREEAPRHRKWADEFGAKLRQTDTGTYVNFLGHDGEERVRAAYPGATWDRLAAIKQRYDPTNLFKLNQNITPPDMGSV